MKGTAIRVSHLKKSLFEENISHYLSYEHFVYELNVPMLQIITVVNEPQWRTSDKRTPPEVPMCPFSVDSVCSKSCNRAQC